MRPFLSHYAPAREQIERGLFVPLMNLKPPR